MLYFNVKSIVIASAASFVIAAGLLMLAESIPKPFSSFPGTENESPDVELIEVNRNLFNIDEGGSIIAPGQESTYSPKRNRVYVPLSWTLEGTPICENQGTTYLWGTCGECVIANTLNLVTGSSYSEADIVAYVTSAGLCDMSSGGMTLNNMADAYVHYLPEDMDVFGYGGSYAPTIEEMADKIESGKILNVSVYGEMMREGGHTGEGDVYGTHWILAHGVRRDAGGNLLGFEILDPASPASYISASDLHDVYYGHDGTKILDPSCIQVFGWRYDDWGFTSNGNETGSIS